MKNNSETTNFGSKKVQDDTQFSSELIAPKCLIGVGSSKELAIQALYKSGIRQNLENLTPVSELVYFIPGSPRSGHFQVFQFSSHVVSSNGAHYFKLVSTQVCRDRFELEVLMGEALGHVAPKRSPQWIERFKRP